MTSLNTILSTAVSGLQTSQLGLNTVSNNVANLNTPGYEREVINQQPLVAGGQSEGVTAGEVQVVTNQYLQTASFQASASAGSASIISNILDQAQSAFGDPTSASSYLNQLSTVFSDFSANANNPTSTVSRNQTLDDLNTFLSSSQQIAGTLSGLSSQADSSITSDVGQVNQLLSQINDLNTEISAAKSSGGDATGAQNSQNQLLTQLSSLIDIDVSTQSTGAVVVRSDSGALLAGYGGAATLGYTPSATAQGTLTITPSGTNTAMPFTAGSGEIQGLLSLRNTQIPQVQAELSSYVSGAVNAINAAHNANTASPPPQTLTGRNTGLDLPTIVGDFTGTTNIAIVNSSGQLQQQVTVDFSNDTVSANGSATTTSFTPSTFLSTLNTALGGAGTATFNNGVLSLNATASGSGVAIADDATDPSSDGGQGFSQFFGLNDLITSNQISNYNTGLQLSDNSGFTPGGQITLQVSGANGAPVTNVTVTIPSSPTMQNLVNALNSPSGGVGLYGSFSLNGQGALAFTPTTAGGASISVVSDTTQGAGGESMTQLFGIGAAQQATLTNSYQINRDIATDPSNLALGQLDLSAAVGETAVSSGDNSGALALANVANANTVFTAAGALGAVTTTLSQYAAQLGGDLSQRASIADDANTTAQAVQTEASSRMQSATGVNLDQELVNMTTYQQAYSASAQLVQASQQMYNALISMMR